MMNNEYERHQGQHHMPTGRYWGSLVLNVTAGLILASVVGVFSMLWNDKDSRDNQNVAIAGMQVQLADLTKELEGVPAMKVEITVLEQQNVDFMRRLDLAEAHTNNLKGWQR